MRESLAKCRLVSIDDRYGSMSGVRQPHSPEHPLRTAPSRESISHVGSHHARRRRQNTHTTQLSEQVMVAPATGPLAVDGENEHERLNTVAPPCSTVITAL